MLTMKKRLLPAMILGALALAQIVPVAANSVTLSYGGCPASGSGTSTRGSTSFGSTYTGTACGYLALQLTWYNGGVPVVEPLLTSSGTYLFDSVPISTQVNNLHRLGTSSIGYDQEFSFAL